MQVDKKDYTCDYCNQDLKQQSFYKDSNIFDGWACDICNRSFSPIEEGFHCQCQSEGFDVCKKCYEKKDCRIKKQFKCDLCRGQLEKQSAYKTSRVFNSWFCDICKEKFGPQVESWHCGCDYEGFDVCDLCYKRQDGRGIYWEEYMQKLGPKNLTKEQQQEENEKVKHTAKNRQKEIDDEEIVEKARRQEQQTKQYHQIMPICLTDSLLSEKEGDQYQQIEKIIRDNYELKKLELQGQSNEKLLEIILKLQLKLGRTILERDLKDQEIQKLKDMYEIRQVVDYPYQSKVQKDCFGLYTGELVNGKRHGKGITVWDDGVKQLGNFVNDILNGYGEIHSGPLDYYKGEFRNGEYDGHGAIQYPDGSCYIGDFSYHKKHGLGKLIENDKDNEGQKIIYYGSWRNGLKHGIFDVEIKGKIKKNYIFQANQMIYEGKEQEEK